MVSAVSYSRWRSTSLSKERDSSVPVKLCSELAMLLAMECGTDLTTDFVCGITTVGRDGYVKDVVGVVADEVQTELTTLKHCRARAWTAGTIKT